MSAAVDRDDGDSSSTEDNERVRVSSTDGEDVSESAAQVKEEEEAGADVSGSAAQVKEEEQVGEDVSESAAQVEEEEEEECGFCIFMKAGPCGERFKLWQDCVEGAEKEEKDIVSQCAQVTTLLKVCMEMNPQYYGPVLEAERAMEADLASAENTSSDGAESSERPAGREGGADSENGGYPVEATEVSVDVVDREGQVLESVDVVEVEVKAI